MIEGQDVVFATRGFDPTALMDAVARAVVNHWPQAVLQDGETGRAYSFGEMPFGKTHEVLIYQDRAAQDAWDSQGSTPNVADKLIHLIIRNDELTLVVHDEASQLARSLIKQTRYLLSAGLPGAFDADLKAA